jgi:hypothetical protein
MFDAGGIEYNIDVETGQLLTADRQVGKFNNKAQKGFTKTTKVADSVSKAIKGTALAATAAALAVGGIAAKIAQANIELDNMSRQARISANDFKALESATSRYGVTGEKIADISKDISDRLGEFITEGSGEFDPFLQVIKATSTEAEALAKEFQTLSGPDVLARMVSMMEDAGASSAQMTTALEAMASDASKLTPLLLDNAKGMREMTGRYKEINGATLVTPEQRESLLALHTNMGLLTGVIGNVTEKIVAGLAPNLNEMIITLAESIPGAIDYLRASFTALFNIVGSDEFLNVAKVYGNQWVDAYNSITQTISDLWDDFKGLFSDSSSWASQSVNFISKAFAQLPNNISTVIKVVATLFAEFVDDIKSLGKFIGTALSTDALINPQKMVASFAKLKEQLKASGAVSKEIIVDLLDENQKLNEQQDEAAEKAIADLKKKIELEKEILSLKGKQTTIESTEGDVSGNLFEAVDPITGKVDPNAPVETSTEDSSLIDGKKYSTEEAESFARGLIGEGMTKIEQMEQDEEKLQELRDQSLLNEELYLEAMNSLQAEMLKERGSLVEQGLGGILTIMENFGDEQSGIYKAMFALQKGFAVAQAAVSLAQNVSQAASVGFPQNIPFIAGAVAQGAQISSMLSSANYQGGRRFGGNVVSGGTYEVNESGVPEIYSAGGKDFMTASENAKITPMSQVGGMGGVTVNVINNMPGAQVVESEDGSGNVTLEVVQAEVEKGRRGAVSDVAGDIASGNGKVSRSLKQSFGLQQRAGVGR